MLKMKFLSDNATEMFSEVVFRIRARSDMAGPSKLFWHPCVFGDETFGLVTINSAVIIERKKTFD